MEEKDMEELNIDYGIEIRKSVDSTEDMADYAYRSLRARDRDTRYTKQITADSMVINKNPRDTVSYKHKLLLFRRPFSPSGQKP